MLSKQIIFALVLFYIFALGNSQVNTTAKNLVTQNVCSNVSYAIELAFCLNDEQSYEVDFDSPEKCSEIEKYWDNLSINSSLNVIIDIRCNSSSNRRKLQARLNREALRDLCYTNTDGLRVYYQEEEDLCEVQLQSPCGCDRHLRCVNLFNFCDDPDQVEDILTKEMIFTDQIYAVLFRKKKEGKCKRTAKLLAKKQFEVDITLQVNSTSKVKRTFQVNSVLHTNNCTESVKIIYAALNIDGLKWLCSKKFVKRITFEMKYINESVCRNLNMSRQMTCRGFTECESYSVSYPSKDSQADCNELVDKLKNPTNSNINATISINDCDKDEKKFAAKLNFEALKLICDSTDPEKVNVEHDIELGGTTTIDGSVVPGPTADTGTMASEVPISG